MSSTEYSPTHPTHVDTETQSGCCEQGQVDQAIARGDTALQGCVCAFCAVWGVARVVLVYGSHAAAPSPPPQRLAFSGGGGGAESEGFGAAVSVGGSGPELDRGTQLASYHGNGNWWRDAGESGVLRGRHRYWWRVKGFIVIGKMLTISADKHM